MVDFLYRVSWIQHFSSLMILRVLHVRDADKCIVFAVGNAIGLVSVIVGLDVVPQAISAAVARGAIGQDNVDVVFAGAMVVGLVTVPVSVSELGLVVHVVERAFAAVVGSSNPEVVLLVADQVGVELVVLIALWQSHGGGVVVAVSHSGTDLELALVDLDTLVPLGWDVHLLEAKWADRRWGGVWDCESAHD